jgi:hypothetical protein
MGDIAAGNSPIGLQHSNPLADGYAQCAGKWPDWITGYRFLF